METYSQLAPHLAGSLAPRHSPEKKSVFKDCRRGDKLATQQASAPGRELDQFLGLYLQLEVGRLIPPSGPQSSTFWLQKGIY